MMSGQRAQLGPLLLPTAVAALALALALGVAAGRAVGRHDHPYAALLAVAAGAVAVAGTKAYLMRRRVVRAALAEDAEPGTELAGRRVWVDTNHNHRPRPAVNAGRWDV